MHGPKSEIVFIHKGDAPYLHFALQQARISNPDIPITLLGTAPLAAPLQQFPLDDLEGADARSFQQHYSHQSSNSLQFELFCYLRWFALYEYMCRKSLDYVWHFDSDVLVYSRMASASSLVASEATCGFLIPAQESVDWTASGHASFWSREMLKEFCDFCTRSYSEARLLNRYKEKWNFHLRFKIPGGICDMTALYLFWESRKDQIVNLARVHDNSVFDLAISHPGGSEHHQFLMSGSRKRVRFRQKQPYFRLTRNHAFVRAHCLHFQGTAKDFMPFYFRGNWFPGRMTKTLTNMAQLGRRSLFHWKSRGCGNEKVSAQTAMPVSL